MARTGTARTGCRATTQGPRDPRGGGLPLRSPFRLAVVRSCGRADAPCVVAPLHRATSGGPGFSRQGSSGFVGVRRVGGLGTGACRVVGEGRPTTIERALAVEPAHGDAKGDSLRRGKERTPAPHSMTMTMTTTPATATAPARRVGQSVSRRGRHARASDQCAAVCRLLDIEDNESAWRKRVPPPPTGEKNAPRRRRPRAHNACRGKPRRGAARGRGRLAASMQSSASCGLPGIDDDDESQRVAKTSHGAAKRL